MEREGRVGFSVFLDTVLELGEEGQWGFGGRGRSCCCCGGCGVRGLLLLLSFGMEWGGLWGMWFVGWCGLGVKGMTDT